MTDQSADITKQMPVWALSIALLIQLPANVSEKPEECDQSPLAPAIHMVDQMEFQAPDNKLAQINTAAVISAVKTVTGNLFLCHSGFQMRKHSL